MDSVTQAALGAAVGEAVLGRKAGNRAILWGAIAGTIPDFDVFIGKIFLNPVNELYFHRGFTHSLLFAAMAAPLFGWLVFKLYKGKRGSFAGWSFLFFLGIATHAWLDCHTTWGTQVFWPHEMRIAWKNIFVIDPIYTFPLLVSVIASLFIRRGGRMRRSLNIIGLVLSSFYMIITILHKNIANNAFELALEEQEIVYQRFDSRPAPLNSILWSVNVETDSSFLLGYYSLLDDTRSIIFYEYPRNQDLIIPMASKSEKVQKLLDITRGFYTVTQRDSTLIINDLRFGVRRPWLGEDAGFVFAYELDEDPDSGEIRMTRQTQSFKGVEEFFSHLWNRMWGYTKW